MAVTIEDIAREAGVSIATVSRVINKTKPVSAELRDRVYEVIEKNHFKPNSLAQGLIQYDRNYCSGYFQCSFWKAYQGNQQCFCKRRLYSCSL